jgi:DEAD/DEAH box helicase domain-containing protein
MYRGIFGSHVSGVFRRLFRLCALYGSNPQVICCSATIRNPEQHFRLLIPSLPSPAKSEGHGTDAKKDQLPANLDFFRNRSLEIVTKDGSPSGAKSICVWNVAVGTRDTVTKPLPFTSESKKTKKRKRSVRANAEQLPPTKDPSDEPTSRVSMSAIYQSSKILAQLVQDEVATLLFCKSRKLTELVLMNTHTILKENRVTAKYVNKVHSYRGGYTAYDRRNIERKFFQGELLGVVATNALELGIDVGGLDCTIHLGLPTSVASLWQQAGRAGRGGKDSLAVIVCFDSPLDQYFARNCEELFQLKPEAVALNPNNATVAKYHLQCAANESPLLSKTTGTLYIDHFIFKDIFSTGSLMLDTLGGFMSASAPPIMSELMSEQKLVLCKDTKGFPGDGGFRLHACVSPIFRQTSIRSIATTVYTVSAILYSFVLIISNYLY